MSKKSVNIGKLTIGDNNKILIQSMTNASTSDLEAVCLQLRELEEVGCDIARLAFSTEDECRFIPKFKIATNMPLVADIQFDYKLAISAMEYGIDKIRFNPGNIGDEIKVLDVISCAKTHKTPIRIGANSGSIAKEYAGLDIPNYKKLVASVMKQVLLCERYGFDNLILSVKSSSVTDTVKAYRELFATTDYPLHLGVTEAGIYENALVKSAAAFGGLLLDGIGDTIRVSITGDPVSEIHAAKKILRALGLEHDYVEVISCPTCSRTKIDLLSLVNATDLHYKDVKFPLKLAIMGCVVNGPGEARNADFGIAGGDDCGVIFAHGEIIKKVQENELLSSFFEIVDKYIEANMK